MPKFHRTPEKDAGFALSEAPQCCFDSPRWHEFVELCGGSDKAMQNLSHPDPHVLVYMRQEVIREGGPLLAQAEMEERRRLVYESLLEGFREQLTSGQLIATGIAASQGIRATIDPDLCRDLTFDFLANSATFASARFSHIRLSKRGGQTDDRSDLIRRCIDWLKADAPDAPRPKKTLLQDKAREFFGDHLTTRAFDEAYKRAFGQKRGRPRNRRENQQ